MEAPDFWDDPEKSQSKMKELKSMKDDVATYAKLKEQYEDIETMIEMGYEENDESLIDYVVKDSVGRLNVVRKNDFDRLYKKEEA